MKRFLRSTYRAAVQSGFDPRAMARSLAGLPGYVSDLAKLRAQRSSARRAFPFASLYPCLGEASSESGVASGHYFHQDLLVARRINLNNPEIHVDVGSRIDGFVAHVAAFRPIEVFDIRPQTNDIPNMKFVQVDLMSPLGPDLVDHCDSLSCLHALEHFGLGRYGDPVDYDGYLHGLENLGHILKAGGKLYLSVPIGPQRIEFNAHRVFSVAYLLECLAETYRVDSFSFVDDRGALHEDVPLAASDVAADFGCELGCGIFELTKK